MKRSLVVVVLSLACGSSSSLGPIPPVDVSKPSFANSSITAEHLRTYVELLASDDYGGRGTLEEGEAKAAAYLASQFDSFGLVPLPGQGSYRVGAELERTGFEVERTHGTIIVGDTKKVITGGVHFKPFGFSASGEVKAEAVFAGYGISRPDLGYDDYEGLDVSGKIVFVLRHAPKKDKSDKRFERGRDSFFVTKAEVARKKGAVGMVLVTDPRALADSKAQGDDLRMAMRLSLPITDEDRTRARKMMASMKKRFDGAKSKRSKEQIAQFVASTAVRYPNAVKAAGFKPSDYAGSKSSIAAVHVSAEVGELLASRLPGSLAEVQGKLDQGKATARQLGFSKRVEIEIEVGKEVGAGRASATNVVGFLPGSDPRLRDEWVVVGAHFDHLGRFDGTGDTVYNGADDNASGTSAMLAVARQLASGPRPRRSIAFVGFSAEEKGLLGSKSLVRSVLGPDKVAFMVNMDMLGRNGDKPVYVGGDGYARGLKDIVVAANQGLDLELEFGGKSISGNSDHAPFYGRGIPVLNLFTGLHEDYHQLSDHPDKLGYGRMARIAQLALRVTRQIANHRSVPAFVHRPLWLGAAIEIEGKDKAARAVITEVEADSPAGKVGLSLGDEVVAVGTNREFEKTRISDVLAEVEPGTETSIAVRRSGKELVLLVKRAKRGYLGVFPGGTDEPTQKKYGLSEGQGVTLRSVVEGGPAAKAGLQKGDILIEIAGRAVGIRSLGKTLARIGAGEKVPVLLIRKGQRVRLTMILGERPER